LPSRLAEKLETESEMTNSQTQKLEMETGNVKTENCQGTNRWRLATATAN
jgi:hypothetical protein